MPENNNVERLIQQKMEGFRLEPSPADWQAIYEKLHPRKNRRLFWWWFPIAAGLLFGGYWYLSPSGSSMPITNATIADLGAAKPVSEPNTASAEPGQTQVKITPVPASSGSPTTVQNRSEPQLAGDPSRNSVTENKNASQPAAAGSEPFTRPTTKNTAQSPEEPSTKAWQPSAKTTTSGISTPAETSSIKPATDDLQNNLTPVPHVQDNSTETINPQLTKSSTIDTLSQVESQNDSLYKSPVTVKKTSIPNLTDHSAKGWYLGAYAELGSNMPTEPVTMTKAADLSSTPSSSGSTTTYEGSGNNGLHWSAGLALERKNNKMSFSFGLGIQHNAWSSSGATYKDSIVNSSFYSRTLLSNNSTSYTHTALEIPLSLNFRIAGNKHSSYWITTGLNNAITVKLNQLTDISMTQNAGNYSLDNSLTSRASIYQPQFRLGLTYENTQKKYHWQLSPFIQYGLNSMVKSGSPDIHLLHLGVQTRYYFKRIK